MKRSQIGVSLVACVLLSIQAMGEKMNEVEILKWKDGKKAVFLLAFDDSCKSHADHAIPELIKRGIPGTFYVCPGQSHWKARKDLWEKEFPKSTVIRYGNHTFNHKGAQTLEEMEEEIRLCQEVLDACYPNAKKPRLISFAVPGGVPWKVTEAERDAVLKKYNLVLRPSFRGIHFGCSNTEQVLRLVDEAIEKGEMGHHDTHGVGGDWGVMPLPMFHALLDKLEACRDVVWATDHISYYQYLTEREGSKVVVTKQNEKQVELELTCTTDSQLFDLPLSLSLKVPVNWTRCTVLQGEQSTSVEVVEGEARFEAAPVTGKILVQVNSENLGTGSVNPENR